MKTKPTPGPFEKCTNHEGNILITAGKGTRVVAFIPVKHEPGVNHEANADLLLASPDLAEACQLTMDYFRDPAEDLLSPGRIKRTVELITKVQLALMRAGVDR